MERGEGKMEGGKGAGEKGRQIKFHPSTEFIVSEVELLRAVVSR
jgi:hypothetical protein